MDLREETEKIILEGYNEANAQAKLCQGYMKAAWQRMLLSKAELSCEAFPATPDAPRRISTSI